MKLKYFIIIGYLVSTVITVTAVFFGISQMLINDQELLFIVLITLGASFVGATVSLLSLSKVFRSLSRLRERMSEISQGHFDPVTTVSSPKEFQELEQSFNKMATDLKDSFAALNESEKEKSFMIAHLTHDIKTPLTSIQATVEGIIDGVIAPSETADYLNTIQRQTQRLNQLVEELNLLTLPSEQASHNEKDVIFLDKLLIDSLSEFQLLIDQEKRQVSLEITPESGKFISDYSKISRIMLNLVSNALKYSEPGTPLEIKASLQNSWLTVHVIDQGIGIAKREQENIFKRLYRVEESRNRETGGLGLGLSIAKELAEQLGGSLDLKSDYGKGSCFTLSLPVLQKGIS